MRRIALLALTALAATPAIGQNRTCRDIRTLVNGEGANFRVVTLSVESRIGVFLNVQGRRLDLPAARDCSLEVEPGEETALYCTWETPDSTRAGALYDRLVGRINPCLDQPMAAGTPFAGGAVRIVQSHSRIVVAGERETSLSLSLFEHPATGPEAPGGARPVRYVISLSVSLDSRRQAETDPAEAGEQN